MSRPAGAHHPNEPSVAEPNATRQWTFAEVTLVPNPQNPQQQLVHQQNPPRPFRIILTPGVSFETPHSFLHKTPVEYRTWGLPVHTYGLTNVDYVQVKADNKVPQTGLEMREQAIMDLTSDVNVGTKVNWTFSQLLNSVLLKNDNIMPFIRMPAFLDAEADVANAIAANEEHPLARLANTFLHPNSDYMVAFYPQLSATVRTWQANRSTKELELSPATYSVDGAFVLIPKKQSGIWSKTKWALIDNPTPNATHFILLASEYKRPGTLNSTTRAPDEWTVNGDLRCINGVKDQNLMPQLQAYAAMFNIRFLMLQDENRSILCDFKVSQPNYTDHGEVLWRQLPKKVYITHIDRAWRLSVKLAVIVRGIGMRNLLWNQNQLGERWTPLPDNHNAWNRTTR